MECRNIYDIVKLIARRDHISEEEARFCIEDCMEEIRHVIYGSGWGMYQEAEDILASELSLEPDYLEILLEELL